MSAPSTSSSRPSAAGSLRVCVIGAGSSGLAGAHRLLQAGHDVDVWERGDDLGGIWNYGSGPGRVFRTTHLVSSKRLTAYPDYPMPRAWPSFPSHRHAQAYLRGYARDTGVEQRILFGQEVAHLHPLPEGGWDVEDTQGRLHRYDVVVVANGHNWVPREHRYPGTFDGEILHAAHYRTSDVLRGRRVVVVGGGNSGCDIVSEAGAVADLAVHSLRRGYHVMPKFLMGMPSDVFLEIFLRLRVPLWMRRLVGSLLLKIYSHELWRYGYPRPDHRMWETHLVLNDLLVHHARHGSVTPKPDIARLDGDTIHFTDGTSVKADLLVLATGYETVFPFMDDDLLRHRDGGSPWHLNLFHRDRDDLFVLGLMQPSQGQWQVVDHQARVVRAYLDARASAPDRARAVRERTRERSPHLGGPVRFVDSPRHVIELEHSTYRRRLDRMLRALGASRRPGSPLPVAEPLEPAAFADLPGAAAVVDVRDQVSA